MVTKLAEQFRADEEAFNVLKEYCSKLEKINQRKEEELLSKTQVLKMANATSELLLNASDATEKVNQPLVQAAKRVTALNGQSSWQATVDAIEELRSASAAYETGQPGQQGRV